ncbi:MAG: flagellar basal body rod protein FlgC [Spongiibacteraceae bacterium]|nr:flagellar basal body rod protein FlgC [Spongiibacteraceae bacterium]
MSMFKVLDIAGSAMNAQMVRLNTTASNMANADSVATTEAEAYRAKQPVFAALLQETANAAAGVQVTGIVESQAPVIKRYEPGNPMADADGYVFGSNVNEVEEMANMISASRSFQNNSEVFNTSKDLMMRTLQLGR